MEHVIIFFLPWQKEKLKQILWAKFLKMSMALYRIEPWSILSELEKDLGVKQSQNCVSYMSWKTAPTAACPVIAGVLYPA